MIQRWTANRFSDKLSQTMEFAVQLMLGYKINQIAIVHTYFIFIIDIYIEDFILSLIVISDMLSFTFYRDILVESNLGSDELTTINPKVGKQNGLRVILDQVFDKNYNADFI